MLACLQPSRRMAMAMAMASVSHLIPSPGALQASASAASADTRSLLSARRVRSFSAASASFSECGSRLRVGTLGAHGLLRFESSKMKSKRMVTSASSEPQVDSRQYFALTYDYIPDILEKRGPYRPGHIELAKALEAEGKMLLGGAWGAPVDGALFIFLVNSADEVQQFVDKDPYIEGGLVTKVTIRPVAAAVGTWVTAAKK
ncbi:hypothetical protein M758_7G124800 [Ceratodon purpureus]|nr:hypothetical protein M758_7G124800 [Ceratodon purpureus]